MKTDDVNLEEKNFASASTALMINSNTSSLFAEFTQSLKDRLGDEVYSSWFGRLQLENLSDSVVRLSVPTAFLRSWINTHYMPILEELLGNYVKNLSKVEVVVRSATRGAKNVASSVSLAAKNISQKTVVKTADKILSVPQPSYSAANTVQSLTLGSPLDPKYTFSSFIEGASNRMALAAAKTVAEAGAGAVRFNPLFIHAAVGLGKTHLLQAIATSMLSRSTPVKVVYFTAEYFMWRFAVAIRDNSALVLKEQLRNIDLLIIDDMQFLQGKSIQNEFCHLLNLLLDSSKQVVVAADRPIADLEMLDDRVKSRLQGGVALEIASPDHAMRLEMLQNKLDQALSDDPTLKIDPQTLNHVASSISGSGRDIEGAFNQLLLCKSFGGDLTIPKINELISHLLRPNDSKRIKIEDIQRIVARHYNVSKQDLLSNRRTRTIVKPRQIAMYLSKILTPRSLPEIGRRFGGRDHTTVLHAVRKVEELLKEDQVLSQNIETLKQFIQEQSS